MALETWGRLRPDMEGPIESAAATAAPAFSPPAAPARTVTAMLLNGRIAMIILLFCSILVTGYDTFIDNHALQLPIVDRLADPTAYPGDPFVDTTPFYASVLWRVVAMVSPVVPTLTQLAVLFVIERVLLLLAFRELARAMVPSSRLAELAAMAFIALAPKPVIAEGTIVTSYMEQTGLAIPFFVLAMAAYLRDRPLACALFMGLGFDLNSLYGVYFATYLGAMMVVDGTWPRLWPRWFVAGGLFLVVSIPALLLSVNAFAQREADASLWVWVSRVRFPHHLYPLTWDSVVVTRFAMLFGLVVAAAWVNRAYLGRLGAQTLAWCANAAVWMVIALVAPLLGVPRLLMLQPGRACDLWEVFAAVFLIAVMARRLEESRIDPRLGVLLFLSSIILWFAPPSVVLLVALLVFGLLLRVRPSSPEAWRRRLTPVVLALVVASALGAYGLRVLQRRSLRNALGTRPPPPIVEVATWAERHTPRNAVFLVDPTWAEFRPLARRPLFTTWKDGAAALWDRAFVGEWTARMATFGLRPQDPLSSKEARTVIAEGFSRLTDEDVLKLRDRYRVSYWIVPRPHPSALPIVYETRFHRVLAVNGGR